MINLVDKEIKRLACTIKKGVLKIPTTGIGSGKSTS